MLAHVDDSMALHWSFDYNHGSQKPDFALELTQLLQGYLENSADVGKDYRKHCYQILPNFWRGYVRQNNPERTSHIGNVVVERQKQNGDSWKYNIHYENTTNGEDIRLHFRCRDDVYRGLIESWDVVVNNNGIDQYSGLKLEGHFSNGSEIRLRYNDVEITAATLTDLVPITCNWALFDVIPNISEQIKGAKQCETIAFLDDLEQFRAKNTVGYLESIESPILLDGYYLHGTGVLPSYWWVDGNENVAIVSSVFETLVLRETEG